MDWKELARQVTDFSAKGMEETGLPMFVIALAFSVLSAVFVSYLYVVFYRSRASGSQVHRAFPLLGLSVTAIFITIQFSLPLSLGLLGALSIVRFRTPIKEPEEIAFIMLVVATSLCCATFNILFLGIVLLVAVGALVVMHFARGARRLPPGQGLLVITVPVDDYRTKGREMLAFLARELPAGALDSVTEGKDESSVAYRFTALQAERISELQNGLRSIAADATASVYVERPGLA